MIFCKRIKEPNNKSDFIFEIDGDTSDIVFEAININAALIKCWREHDVPDEEIEKQLVNCIIGGFDIADRRKKRE